MKQPPLRILIILQAPNASAGRCHRKLQERGYQLDYCYPQAGQPLPVAIEHYAGVVILGGPMSANDDKRLPGIRNQLDWIPHVLISNRPLLGICLGAQLLARTLGATVKPHSDGLAEIGYFPLQSTVAGHCLFNHSLPVYHWHREGFDLPTGADLLATGERFPHQAYRYGTHTFGLQFHPEVDQPILEAWLAEGAADLDSPGAQSAAEQRHHHTAHDTRLDRWFDHFLDCWLGQPPPHHYR